jgi:hypothetical protein
MGLFFAHFLTQNDFLISSCLMSLILYGNVFPNVRSIWHPLYKKKHMLAIRGAVWVRFLGNRLSYAILRNLHFHYLFEKVQKCWALMWPSELGKGCWILHLTYFAQCPEQKDIQHPRSSSGKGKWHMGLGLRGKALFRDPAQTYSPNDWLISTSAGCNL